METGMIGNVFWGAVLLVCGAGLLRSEYEKRHFSVEEYEIVSKKIRKEKTLVFLSDLHDQEFGKDNEELCRAIDQAEPDMILIGGDMMITEKKPVSRKRVETVTDAAETLILQLAGKYPVYYGMGNHEQRLKEKKAVYGCHYEAYERRLKQAGVLFLSDRNEAVSSDLAIGGVDIPWDYYKKFSKKRMKAVEIQKKLGQADESRFQILMAHSPLVFQACREWGADLTLSGHFHGGTIRLPLIGGVMTPQYQFFCPECAGSFQQDGKRMIVSRGLGTHSIRIRFCNKPQAVVVKLKKTTIF